MTRKVYVLGYRPLEDDQLILPKRPFERVEDLGVGYTDEPGWTMADRREAEGECATLRGMAVRVGMHYCDFAVETLDTGEFTIVCLSHPTEFALSRPVADRGEQS